jgi:hypothetical protein
MQHYRVTFADASALQAISFEAKSLNEALTRVARHQASAPADLWCDGKHLGRLEYLRGEEGSFWRVG